LLTAQPNYQDTTAALHDALPIYVERGAEVDVDAGLPLRVRHLEERRPGTAGRVVDDDVDGPDFAGRPDDRVHVVPPADVAVGDVDRQSTRLNSNHVSIWFGVYCL